MYDLKAHEGLLQYTSTAQNEGSFSSRGSEMRTEWFRLRSAHFRVHRRFRVSLYTARHSYLTAGSTTCSWNI